MSDYHYEFRSKSGQTMTGIFLDRPTLKEAMKRCQNEADRLGVRVTLCETRMVKTALREFEPGEVSQ